MPFTPTLNLNAHITATSSLATRQAAEEAARILEFNVSNASGSRSGIKYRHLPVRSSVNVIGAEFPASQSGDFQKSIEVRKGDDSLSYRIGSFGDNAEKVRDLEFGNPARNFAARAPIQRTLEDPQTWAAMLKAALTK